MKTILTILIQILLFYLLVNLLWLFFGLFIENISYPDKYVYITSLLIFTFLVIFQHIMTYLVKKHKSRFLITVSIALVCFLIWGEDINSFPFTAIIFSCSSAVSILAKQTILRAIDQLSW